MPTFLEDDQFCLDGIAPARIVETFFVLVRDNRVILGVKDEGRGSKGINIELAGKIPLDIHRGMPAQEQKRIMLFSDRQQRDQRVA